MVHPPEPVPRGGRLTLRDERAAQTRARIVEAARRLFRSTGYGATTIRAIADEAGVAVQTVYAVHGSKAGILRELREKVVHQPQAEALFGQALDAASPAEALTLFARSIRTRWEAGADIVRIYADAAATDAELRAELEMVLARRGGGLTRLAQSLVEHGASAAEAAAVLDALTLPEAYLRFTTAHGWTPEQYERWLAGALQRELLELRTDLAE